MIGSWDEDVAALLKDPPQEHSACVDVGRRGHSLLYSELVQSIASVILHLQPGSNMGLMQRWISDLTGTSIPAHHTAFHEQKRQRAIKANVFCPTGAVAKIVLMGFRAVLFCGSLCQYTYVYP